MKVVKNAEKQTYQREIINQFFSPIMCQNLSLIIRILLCMEFKVIFIY